MGGSSSCTDSDNEAHCEDSQILGIAGQPNWDHAHRKHAPTCLWHASYSRQMHKEWQFPSEEYRQFLTVLPGYQLQDSGHRCNLPLHSPCQRHSQNLYKRYYNKVSRIQILPYTSPIDGKLWGYYLLQSGSLD